jgi:prevent-host-death family protein
MKDPNAMEKTVSFQDAPGRFGDLLQGVSDKGDRYVVEQDGVPLAAVVPFALYSQWKRRREGFFGQMRQAADRAGSNETEATRLADVAKREVRSQP